MVFRVCATLDACIRNNTVLCECACSSPNHAYHQSYFHCINLLRNRKLRFVRHVFADRPWEYLVQKAYPLTYNSQRTSPTGSYSNCKVNIGLSHVLLRFENPQSSTNEICTQSVPDPMRPCFHRNGGTPAHVVLTVPKSTICSIQGVHVDRQNPNVRCCCASWIRDKRTK